MSKSTAKIRSEPFSEFLDRFQQRVSSKPLSSNDFRISLKKDLPGLFNLLSSFSSVAAATSKPETVKEWNPFSQRPFIPERHSLKDPSLLVHFDKAVVAIDAFIEIAHEANHVLLWEPLFAGKCKDLPRNRFVETNLAFEAYCFWYADIIVTRNIRTRLPDGEFTKIRNAVSQPHFHPYRAFKAMGIKRTDEILNIYFQSFLRGESELYRNRKKPYSADLFTRFIGMHDIFLKPSHLFFNQLHTMNTFGDFRERFCNLAGMPSLLPDRISNMDFLKEPWAYCHAIRKDGYRHLENRTDEEISRVRLRRYIQTRAYTAYSLYEAIESGNVFSRKNKKIENDKMLSEIRHYINALETTIQALCKGTSMEHIRRVCKNADRMYAQKIRSIFVSKDIWMSRRAMIFPKLDTKTGSFGILGDGENVSRSDMEKLNTMLLNRFCGSKLPSMATSKTASAKMTARDVGKLLDVTSEVSQKWTGKNIKRWKLAYNKLLQNPDILQAWSFPLSFVDPENNKFREVLFVYE